MRGFEAKQKNPGDMQDFLQDNGMALRYKKDDENAGNGAFSEIGFYQKNAKWPTTRDGNASYDRQDTINIQSTGDIESRAENYHLVKARRLEILAGDAAREISPGKRIENANSDSWSEGEAPLGDHVLDDPELHKGDIHIRAGKRVIIKAEDEIRLQVGRTTLVINDKGFSVVSKKMNSNVPTTFDTSLSLDPRTGISMFGQTVGIAAGHSFALREGLGGVVSSTAGILSLGGREVKAASSNMASQIYSSAMYIAEYAVNMTTAGIDLNPNGKSVQKRLYIADKILQMVKILGNAVYVISETLYTAWLYKNNRDVKDIIETTKQARKDRDEVLRTDSALITREARQLIKDIKDPVDMDTAVALIGLEPYELFAGVLGLILNMTNDVYASLDSLKKFTPEDRDKLNYIAMGIDNGIIETAASAMAAAAVASVAPAMLRLRHNGDAAIKAAKGKTFYAVAETKGAATAPILSATITNTAKIGMVGGAALADIAKLSIQLTKEATGKLGDLQTEEL
jgi:hypothetical protein